MANFTKYFGKLTDHEGGYVDHPNDPGGATKYGVTLATWRTYGKDLTGDGKIDKGDVKVMTKQHALPVYKRAYWDALNLDMVVNQSVAEIIFDHGVNAGVSRAAKMAQYILKHNFRKDIEVDGQFGAISVAALNCVDQEKFFFRFKYLRLAYYNFRANKSEKGLADPANIFFHRELKVSPSDSAKVFLKGWLTRMASFKYTA